jgi:hypothetical protein
MDDLILKYFQDDLTEAESEDLRKRLESSTEDALRFGEEAEKKYAQYGLPEPKWPGNPDHWPRPKGGSWSEWIWFGGLIMALAGGMIFWYERGNRPSSDDLEAKVTAPADSKASVPTVKKKAPKVSSSDEGKSLSPDSGEQAAEASRPPAVLTPVNLALHPRSTHPNLSVAIRRAQAGEVRVRVLDSNGDVVALLYEGMLQPGNWAFDWDGKLPDGRMASKGLYQIEVKSGPTLQHKNIHIR